MFRPQRRKPAFVDHDNEASLCACFAYFHLQCALYAKYGSCTIILHIILHIIYILFCMFFAYSFAYYEYSNKHIKIQTLHYYFASAYNFACNTYSYAHFCILFCRLCIFCIKRTHSMQNMDQLHYYFCILYCIRVILASDSQNIN